MDKNWLQRQDKLIELKEFLDSKGLKTFLTGDEYLCVFCNGFSIKYREGSYQVINIRNRDAQRHLPTIEDVYVFITETFFKISRGDYKEMLAIIKTRKYLTPLRIVNRMKRTYPLTRGQKRKIISLLENNKNHVDFWFVKRITEITRERSEFCSVTQARREVLSMIPKDIPAYKHVSIPFDKNEMLDNKISIRDFVLLNAMYTYPPLITYFYKRRKKGTLVPMGLKGHINIYEQRPIAFHMKKKVPKTFWKDIDQDKDYLYDKTILMLTNNTFPMTSMSGRASHILKEIAAFYGIKCINCDGIEWSWTQQLISHLNGRRLN